MLPGGVALLLAGWAPDMRGFQDAWRSEDRGISWREIAPPPPCIQYTSMVALPSDAILLLRIVESSGTESWNAWQCIRGLMQQLHQYWQPQR